MCYFFKIWENRQQEPWGRHGSRLSEGREALGLITVFCILIMIFQSAGRNVFGDFSQLLQKSMHPETAKYFI